LINKEAVHAMATACFLPSTSLELLEIHIHIHIHCCTFATTLQKLPRQRETHIHIHTTAEAEAEAAQVLSNLSIVCFDLITTIFVVIRSVINI
jgi:hypothetical protein